MIAASRSSRLLPRRLPKVFVAYGGAALAVAVAAAVGEMLSAQVPLPNVSLVFLVAVLLAAVRYGVGPAIVASILSFLAYNFFFIEPVHSLTVAQPHELLSLVVYLVIAVVTATVAGQARDQALAAVRRVRVTRRLYEFTRRLFAVSGPQAAARVLASELEAALGRRVAVVLGEGDASAVAAASPGTAPTLAEVGGPGWHRIPIASAGGAVGTVGVARRPGEDLDEEDQALIAALAEQAAAAFDHMRVVDAAAAAQRAAEAERIRNTMLASISHDFRTPLASIQGAASSLAEFGSAMRDEDRDDLLGQIREEAEHLDAMVRNLLSITRVEAGALELNRTWVDLREVADRVVSALRRRGATQPVTVTCEPDVTLVHGDQSLLDQALGNLLGNAVAHGGPGVRIAVAISRDGGALVVTVTDDGPGIAPALLPRIFEKFVSGRARADGGEGTGLGLAIARGIVEAHGGRITAASPVADGHGTRFTLRLPVDGEPGR